MAKLNITEYTGLARDAKGISLNTGVYPPVASQNLIYTVSDAVSDPFSKETSFVRVVADTDTRIEFGDDPEANTSTSMYLPAGVIEWFNVRAWTKISAITAI